MPARGLGLGPDVEAEGLGAEGLESDILMISKGRASVEIWIREFVKRKAEE